MRVSIVFSLTSNHGSTPGRDLIQNSSRVKMFVNSETEIVLEQSCAKTITKLRSISH